MNSDMSDAALRLEARFSDLESRYTHVQRTVEEMNAVVIEQEKRIDTLERKVALLAGQLGSLAERETEPRTLEDDKPPHY